MRTGEGQRDGDNLKQAPGFELSAQSPDAGLELTNRRIMSSEIMTGAKVGCLTEPPGRPLLSTFILVF